MKTLHGKVKYQLYCPGIAQNTLELRGFGGILGRFKDNLIELSTQMQNSPANKEISHKLQEIKEYC